MTSAAQIAPRRSDSRRLLLRYHRDAVHSRVDEVFLGSRAPAPRRPGRQEGASAHDAATDPEPGHERLHVDTDDRRRLARLGRGYERQVHVVERTGLY